MTFGNIWRLLMMATIGTILYVNHERSIDMEVLERRLDAALAQMEELDICNMPVVGSILTGDLIVEEGEYNEF